MTETRRSIPIIGSLALTYPSPVRYETVCTQVKIGSKDHLTYGLQCLRDSMGTWVQVDMIEDVSPSRDNVLHLADRFNHLQLSPLHFRDAVLDSVNV